VLLYATVTLNVRIVLEKRRKLFFINVRGLCLVRPYLNEVDRRRTEQIVYTFEQGVGKDLHNELLEVATGSRNWVRVAAFLCVLLRFIIC